MKKDFVEKLHMSTSRNYLERMINEKVECMKIARRFDKEFWDGERKYGYGGHKYIPGRWSNVADQIIKNYNLKEGSKILDVGCSSGNFLFEIYNQYSLEALVGIDIDNSAIKEAKSQNIDRVIFKNTSLLEIDSNKEQFDIILFRGTFQYLDLDIHKSIGHIKRLLKNNGKKLSLSLDFFSLTMLLLILFKNV